MKLMDSWNEMFRTLEAPCKQCGARLNGADVVFGTSGGSGQAQLGDSSRPNADEERKQSDTRRPDFENFEVIQGIDGQPKNITVSAYVNHKVIDAPPVEVVKKFAAHQGECLDLTYSAMGDILVTSGSDMRLKWWNTTKMVETQSTLLRGKPASVIAMSSDGEFLFAGTTDKRGTLFKVRNGIK